MITPKTRAIGMINKVKLHVRSRARKSKREDDREGQRDGKIDRGGARGKGWDGDRGRDK